MSGGLRYIVMRTEMDGFEGVKWSRPKEQAHFVYCNIVRNRLSLAIKMLKGKRDFTCVNG